ncbi:hydroxycarboxylic acid receptor 2-like, partial [Silurus asotus]
FIVYDCLKRIYFGFILTLCIMTFCALIGTPANLWCLWFYFCIERKVKQTHVFLLNVIIIELIFCLLCVAEMLNLFIFNNDTYLSVTNFVLSLSWSGRPLIQTCICTEQYLAVRHPIIFLRYKGIKYRIAAVVVVWFILIGYAACNQISQTFPDPFINSVFIITLIMISFCCVSVLFALKHPGPGDTHTGRDVGNQQKRNAFNTIFSALLLILFSYFPQAVLSVFTGCNDQLLLKCNIIPLLTSFNIFGVMVTPLLKMYK